MRAQPSRSPTYIQDPVQLRRPSFESRAALEWVSGVDSSKLLNDKRFIGGLDPNLQVAVSPPPQRPVDAPRAAVHYEYIFVSGKDLSLDLAAIPLLKRPFVISRYH